MNKPMKRIIILILMASWVFQPAFTQQFTWEAEVAPSKTAGFHEIRLPTLSTCDLKPDYGDLRLFEAGSPEEVPYLLREPRDPGVTEAYAIDLGVRQMNDSLQKHSLIPLELSCPYTLDRIWIYVQFNGKFYRKVELRESNIPGVYTDSRLVRSFVLDEKEEEFTLPQDIYGPDLFLKVYNEDNRPLTIEKVQLGSPGKSLIAELDPEKRYLIRYGNPHVSAPVYDLRHFANEIVLVGTVEIPGNPVRIYEGELIPEQVVEVAEAVELPWYKRPVLIWGVLIVVVVMLGFMTVKMLKNT
jgi:hypothetical protein